MYALFAETSGYTDSVSSEEQNSTSNVLDMMLNNPMVRIHKFTLENWRAILYYHTPGIDVPVKYPI